MDDYSGKIFCNNIIALIGFIAWKLHVTSLDTESSKSSCCTTQWVFGLLFHSYVLTSPVIISYFKPKTSTGTALQPRELVEELRFDRHLAQASLLLDGTADLLVAIASGNSETIFIALSCVTSFTSGSDPALHSLGAVCLHACGYSSEVGTLLGAKAVLSAVAHIVSVSSLNSTRSCF